MLRKKLTVYLVGVAALIVPLLVTAQPAGATTTVRTTASAVSAISSDVVTPMSWYKYDEFEHKWECNEHGEWLVTTYPLIFCNWSCVYRRGIYELLMQPCGSSPTPQDVPAHAAVKL